MNKSLLKDIFIMTFKDSRILFENLKGLLKLHNQHNDQAQNSEVSLFIQVKMPQYQIMLKEYEFKESMTMKLGHGLI